MAAADDFERFSAEHLDPLHSIQQEADTTVSKVVETPASKQTPGFYEVAVDTIPLPNSLAPSPYGHVFEDNHSETVSLTSASNVSNVFDDDAASSATRRTSIPYPSADSELTYPPSLVHSLHDVQSSPTKLPLDSQLIAKPNETIILGVALVNFNHLVGPQIEWSEGAIFDDTQVVGILPFLALPDGSHMNSEDYSYFHVVPSSNNPKTLFGISCNRQIPASELMIRGPDVTRSIVQKAVVVIAVMPIFGLIRDKLGVVTQAFFEQRDFTQKSILSDFHSSLETTVKNQMTENSLYIGTNLRALVHAFRHRTLLLLKALLLQKKILFYGHPVELLCTYQYSLVSLIPGLLQTLVDCGSPPLASRATTVTRSSSLKTSDRNSLLAYLGQPLDVFGKDAFFQPYIPLQQLDLLNDSRSWLCGTTNTMVTQLSDVDLLIKITDMSFEFRNPQLEKTIGITSADRAWIDELVKDVNDSWNPDDPTRTSHMQFKGSEDYVRTKFEEYIFACLSSLRYAQFMSKSAQSGVSIAGTAVGEVNAWQHFHPIWISALKETTHYAIWDRVADPMIFDIVEPKHPGAHRVTTMGDLGLRLQEGLHDWKIDQQLQHLAPTRDALNTALTTSSAGIMKAMDGVRDRWNFSSRRPSVASLPSLASMRRTSTASIQSALSISSTSTSSTPVEVNKKDLEETPTQTPVQSPSQRASLTTTAPSPQISQGLRSIGSMAAPLGAAAGTKVSSWGAGIGSFLSSKTARLAARQTTPVTPDPPPIPVKPIAIGMDPPITTSPAIPTPTLGDHVSAVVTPSAAFNSVVPELAVSIIPEHIAPEPAVHLVSEPVTINTLESTSISPVAGPTSIINPLHSTSAPAPSSSTPISTSTKLIDTTLHTSNENADHY